MTNKILLLVFISSVLTCCRNRFYDKDDYADVRKIDAHIHIGSDDGVFEDQAGKDNFLLLTLNVDHGGSENIRKQYDYALRSSQIHPGRIFFGITFLFDTAEWETNMWSEKVISQLDKDLVDGAVTVKIWKNIGMTVRDRSGKFIMADDPGLDPVIEYIKSKGLPITGHLGEPRNCWLPLSEMTVKSDSGYFANNPQYHMFLHPEYPSYEDQINARDKMLEKHPDLIFIGCHLGSLEWNVDSLAMRLDKYPNMAVDMSARICHLQYQSAIDWKKVRDFCIKYQDRLLYGTDEGYRENMDPDKFREEMHSTWSDDWKYFTTRDQMSSDLFSGKFRGLHLPKRVVDKIYRENAVKWYKLPVTI